MYRSESVIAIPPGETIKESLELRNMSQNELAKRINISEKHLSLLINGEVPLSMNMAIKLEMVFNIPTGFWCNLENIYREDIERAKMEDEKSILFRYPYKEW